MSVVESKPSDTPEFMESETHETNMTYDESSLAR